MQGLSPAIRSYVPAQQTRCQQLEKANVKVQNFSPSACMTFADVLIGKPQAGEGGTTQGVVLGLAITVPMDHTPYSTLPYSKR